MVGARPRPLLAILFLIAGAAWCQGWDELARGLAQKMASALQPREPVALSFSNVSSMAPSDAAAAQTALQRELRALGVMIAGPAEVGVEAAVTLSENWRDLVWVAEIRRGQTREVVMEQRPKTPATAGASSLVIEKKLMLDQERRILDLAPLGRALLVLDAEAVSVYEGSGGGWQRKLSARIPVSHAWPRDLRGRLVVDGDAYQAYLPGAVCNGNAAGGLSITCRDDELWPLGANARGALVPTRNYFDGIVLTNGLQKRVPSFFTAARLGDHGHAPWVLAGTDGRTRLYNAMFELADSWGGWGSEIAAVENECGARVQVLATAPGDDTAVDSVRAYEMLDGAPRPVGDAAAFSGPVTALWPAPERGVAFAVSRDLKSGRYAAFRLAITCAH